MIPLLDEQGAPITVPEGPVDPKLREKIEKALQQTVPEGKKFGVIALYDLEHRAIDAQIAVKLDKSGDWKFAIGTHWDRKDLSGFVGLAGSF